MITPAHLPLDHAVILLSNLEASLPFYEALLSLLGFTRVRGHVFANPDGTALFLKDADGMRIEVGMYRVRRTGQAKSETPCSHP